MGPTHREEVTERYVREDLMGSVLCALTLALSPEPLQSFQQGPRGAEEEGVLLGDGVIQRRVITMTTQPVREQADFTRATMAGHFPRVGGSNPAPEVTRCTNSPPAPRSEAGVAAAWRRAPPPQALPHMSLIPGPKTKTVREGGLVFKQSLGARKFVENIHISFYPTSN